MSTDPYFILFFIISDKMFLRVSMQNITESQKKRADF